jgi:5,10-methylenetetrahydrofolate reductase
MTKSQEAHEPLTHADLDIPFVAAIMGVSSLHNAL